LRHRDPDQKNLPLTNDLGGAAIETGQVGWDADRRRRDGFEKTVLPHLDAAYSLARWLTRNDADAGDVVQEASLRAFRYFDGYRGGDAKSWLLKIVRHTCYGWLALNRPAYIASLDAEAKFGGEVAAASIDVEALLESRSELRRLDQLIEALPAPLRETIVLRELHELGYREIAEVTGVPIGTVMSRLYRARSLLLRASDGAPGACPRPDKRPESVRKPGVQAGMGELPNRVASRPALTPRSTTR
jgi:RNA polymerase sigma-70 factor, ECF subfamily